MKKLSLLLAVISISFISVAQSSDVTSAILTFQKAIQSNEVSEYEKAKNFIDKAYGIYTEKNGVGVKEKIACKLFKYRGEIYLRMAAGLNVQLIELAGPDGLDIATNSYEMLSKVDGAGKFKKEVVLNLMRCSDAYQNQGYKLFDPESLGRPAEPGDYKRSVPSFVRALEIKQMPQLSDQPLDSALVGNIAIIAFNGGDMENATKYYNMMVKNEIKLETAYTKLVEIYILAKDYDLAKSTLDAAKAKIGTNMNLIIQEVNMYLELKEVEKALAPLKLAVEKDPSNALFQNALGGIYVQIGDFDNAIPCFKAASTLDPTMNNPWYQMGYIDVQYANEWNKKANDLKMGDSKYKGYVKKRQDFYRSAMANFEKGLEADPESYDTLKALKEVYYQLDENEKLKAVIAKLKTMEG